MSLLPVEYKSFFVGSNREDGLGLRLVYEDGLVSCDLDVDKRFEGYENVVHGGMLFGILDVMMWYAIFLTTRKVGLTRKTDMDFLKPVLCDTAYHARARFLRMEEKDIYASAWIEDENHEICAEVTALFRAKKGLPDEEFMSRFDFSDASPQVKEIFFSPSDNGSVKF